MATLAQSKADVQLKPENFAKLNMVEQALLVKKLTERGYKQREIAQLVDMSNAQISNLMTIYDLPNDLKNMIAKGTVKGTLVLQAIRELPEFKYTELEALLKKIQGGKGGATITYKDLLAATGKHNSMAYASTFLKKYGHKDVKRNRTTYEFMVGVMNGLISNEQFNRFFLGDAAA